MLKYLCFSAFHLNIWSDSPTISFPCLYPALRSSYSSIKFSFTLSSHFALSLLPCLLPLISLFYVLLSFPSSILPNCPDLLKGSYKFQFSVKPVPKEVQEDTVIMWIIAINETQHSLLKHSQIK